jgi:hypothetical protein
MARLEWHGDTITIRQHGRMPGALLAAAEYLLEQANRSVPIEEGTLEGSGSASAGWSGQSGAKAHVSYNTPYAVRQHEDLSYSHDAGRRAKWLEATAYEQEREVAAIIAQRLES